MADALLIADLSGREELLRVQQLYMKKQPSPYMRVVKAIQGNDFVSKCRFCAYVLCTVQDLLSQYMGLIKMHLVLFLWIPQHLLTFQALLCECMGLIKM